MKYWVSKEFVNETNTSLWHVWKKGITHSTCVDAFDDKSLADTYCKFLNNN